MTKYIFTSIDEDGDKITHEFSSLHIHSVVERFESFLSGCGFVFDGHLEFVDEFNEDTEPLFDYTNSCMIDDINLDEYTISVGVPQSSQKDDVIK